VMFSILRSGSGTCVANCDALGHCFFPFSILHCARELFNR
jgi:hypothetical protein